jgi:hypothetical protein
MRVCPLTAEISAIPPRILIFGNLFGDKPLSWSEIDALYLLKEAGGFSI